MQIFISLYFAQLWTQRLFIQLNLTIKICCCILFIYIFYFIFFSLKRTILNHISQPTFTLTLYPPKIAINPPLFIGVASISKLKEKVNYKEWRNVVQGFCKMNRLWRYIIGEIIKSKVFSPLDGKKLDKKTKKAYNTKLF